MELLVQNNFTPAQAISSTGFVTVQLYFKAKTKMLFLFFFIHANGCLTLAEQQLCQPCLNVEKKVGLLSYREGEGE